VHVGRSAPAGPVSTAQIELRLAGTFRVVRDGATPEPTRLAHHRRAADLLTGQPESLARHAAAAGAWLRAARAWLRAGDDAMGRYAASDAAALATQALEAGEQVADAEVSARALVLRGRALEAAGAHEAPC